MSVEWERRAGSDFADALALGRVLVLADGVNELPRQERSQKLKAWRLFTQDYAEANQVVFTSRERDYDQQLDLPRVLVEPLDDDRIADYLQRNAAEDLGDLLDDPRNNLRRMARNPFNLALLTQAYKQSDRQPLANRGKLLAWFTGELLHREEKLAHPGWLPCEIQERALACLAYAMQQSGESTAFPLAAARAALPGRLDCKGEEIDIPSADLLRFARAAVILDPAVEPEVRFYHQLLQEYFAARELLRRFEAGEDVQPLWQAPRRQDEMPAAQVGEWDALPEPPSTGWEVTTLLACGLSQNPAALIQALRPVNPALAGRCLAEAGVPDLGETAQAVRQDLLVEIADPQMHLRARLQAGFVLGRAGDPRFAPQEINGVRLILPQLLAVPGGSYLIGSADGDKDAYDDEKPPRSLELAAFSIARWPVTNAEFACFIQAGGYQEPRYWQTDLARRWLSGEDVTGGPMTWWIERWQWLKSTPDWRKRLENTGNFSPSDLETWDWIAGLSEEELRSEVVQSISGKSRQQPAFWQDERYNNPSQPVVGVTWFEACSYCAWLAEVTGRVYRLPGEAEWEAAARGLPLSPGRKKSLSARHYPWGDDWDPAKANTLEGRALRPSPVGVYAAAGGVGPFGAEDQSGNVWEWTASLYRPYPYQPENDDPHAEGERVLRGGGWNYARRNARCASRLQLVPGDFTDSVGFRAISPGIVQDSVS